MGESRAAWAGERVGFSTWEAELAAAGELMRSAQAGSISGDRRGFRHGKETDDRRFHGVRMTGAPSAWNELSARP